MSLAGGFQRGLATLFEYGQAVFIAPEAVLNQIADNEWNLLAEAFLFRVGREIFAFGGKADAQRRGGQGRDRRENVRIKGEFDRCRCLAFFLYLLFGGGLRAVIGYGGDADENILRCHALHDSGVHFQRTAHVDARDAPWRWLRDRATD